MQETRWIAVDTETSGIHIPIYAVEIAAQRMRGWEPEGESFRVLLNHDVPIESTAEALHGYSRVYLRKHGIDPVRAHALFAEYAGDCPMVAYNLGFDWKRVLVPEYSRLGIKGAGREGFCALTLARRVIEETENYRLETMKTHFQLGSGRSHKAMNDVETMVKLMSQVMAPRLERAGIWEWEEVARFSRRGPISWCREVVLGGGKATEMTKSKSQMTNRVRAPGIKTPIGSRNDATVAKVLETDSKAFYVMHYDPWINELFEICKGVLAVEVIGEGEIRVLSDWLENCPCTHLYPVNVVSKLVAKWQSDLQVGTLREGLFNILPA